MLGGRAAGDGSMHLYILGFPPGDLPGDPPAGYPGGPPGGSPGMSTGVPPVVALLLDVPWGVPREPPWDPLVLWAPTVLLGCPDVQTNENSHIEQ